MARLCPYFLLVCLSACSASKSTTNTRASSESEQPPRAQECATLRGRLGKLYAAQSAQAPKSVADNVEMVLDDCQRSPARVLPCAREAETAEELESTCLIPIDDQGQAEARRFGAAGAAESSAAPGSEPSR